MRAPLELLAFETNPSLILSLFLVESWLCSSTSGWNLLCCLILMRVGSTSALCARLSGEVSTSLWRGCDVTRATGAFPLLLAVTHVLFLDAADAVCVGEI